MDFNVPNTALPAEPYLTSRDPGSVPFVLTPPDIREFQQLLREHCGVVLDDAEAAVRANELVMLYRVLLGPIPEDPELPAESAGSNTVAIGLERRGKVS